MIHGFSASLRPKLLSFSLFSKPISVMPLFLTILLLLILLAVCAFLVLIILMQRASSNSGMGSALGGGAAESALGGGATTVLTKGTIGGTAVFFVLCFILYLGFINHSAKQNPAVQGKTQTQLLQEAAAGANAAAEAAEAAEAAIAPQAQSGRSLVELPASSEPAAAPQAE